MEEMQVISSQVRPWVRFWARMMDYTIMGLVLYVILGIATLFVAVPLWMFWGVGFFTPLIWILIEAWFIAVWGATPGKALLQVSVTKEDGTHLCYGRALHRAFSVWVRGIGLGLPIVMLVAMIVAYAKLTIHKITTWDRKLAFRVKHEIIGGGRIVLYIVFMFAVHLALSSTFMLAVLSMVAAGIAS
jgi:uncharacterized RDD family membrane protein YckC